MPPVDASSGPVAVTGASGYIGAAVVKNLLENGYHVRACVRDVCDPDRVDHLRNMTSSDGSGTLELFACDLMMPGSYDDVFRGCAAVFHVAAVMERDHKGGLAGSSGAPVRQVYDGGVDGTRYMLASVRRSGSVRRVVLTSSIAAILHPAQEGYEFSERDWGSDRRKAGEWTVEKAAYAKSKVDAERLAVRTAAEDGSFDVISHCHRRSWARSSAGATTKPGSYAWVR
jgi:dihydroflavonol-4-reductase